MTPPMRDPALGVEVGIDVQRALMTVEDWSEVVDRFLETPSAGCPCGHTTEQHQDVAEHSSCPCGCAVAAATTGGSQGQEQEG